MSPAGLDRAALEACVGAAFYPGIEASWKMRDVFKYVEPFRLDPQSLSPGDISQQMSLPWQTDFVDCAYEDPYVWWPAQRPINVHKQDKADYVKWDRTFVPDKPDDSIEPIDMLHEFYRLGHVLRSEDQFFEAGRLLDDSDPDLNAKNFKNQRKIRFSQPAKKP
jgi:hypothetical protein